MDARFLHRFGLIVALAAAFAGMGASLLYCFPVTVSCEIDVASIRHSEGNAYVVSMSGHLPGGFANVLFEVEPDSPGSPSASRLRLLEDGVQFGVPHSIHADIAQKGQGRFSDWGSDILFSTPDSSSPIKSGRMYSMRYPVSPPWWLPLALLMGGIAGLSCIFNLSHVRAWQVSSAESTLFGVSEAVYSFATAKRHYLFWGAVALVGLYLNTVFVLLLPAPVAAPDSSTYLIWSLFRTVGYSAFLYGYHQVFPTWEYLPLVQLNLLIAGVVCLSYAVVSVTRSYVIGWLVLALVVHAENMLLSAADMLTEAPFSACIMMHVAFMYLLFKGNRTYFGLLAGLSLAAAILIKSVAVVFLGPLLLLLLFLPEWRRPVFLLVLCPAVVAWLAPSAYNLARYGFFESSIASGYALGGHVAAWIHPHAGSAFPGEAARIESRLEGVLAKRPAQFNTMDDYINYTANEYNGLLWGNIVPEMSAYYSNICPPVYLEYFQFCSLAWSQLH